MGGYITTERLQPSSSASTATPPSLPAQCTPWARPPGSFALSSGLWGQYYSVCLVLWFVGPVLYYLPHPLVCRVSIVLFASSSGFLR